MKTAFKVRLARVTDALSISEIYRHYVLNTAISFEYEPPSEKEMASRIQKILERYPFIICLKHHKVIGYCYATDFKERIAYQWSVESAIYISPDHVGSGIGKVLYQVLIDTLRMQGFFNVFGGVAIPNKASVHLHLKLGFTEFGTYHKVGYKLGAWHSTSWFQLSLKEYESEPAIPRQIREVTETDEFKDLLIKAENLLNR